MPDGITWLAEPHPIDWFGYSVTIAQDIAGQELARRVAGTKHGSAHEPRTIGQLTGQTALDLIQGLYGDSWDGIILRHGEIGEWAFVVKHGGWYVEFDEEPAVSHGGAHVFHLEYQEQNGKPVPPHFAYWHDGRRMCSFNLHLDTSWGDGEITGEDEDLVTHLRAEIEASGLPLGDTGEPRFVHWSCLDILEQRFGLTLPRAQITEGMLPAVLLKGPSLDQPV
ncbi:DUF6461 domain-containing protein [Streptomyces sp. NPDC001848]|uniref:DUF6461 domain-containing protein n=1 Tax=Streptomyces sp. NPDC001848 TaxID=3364618 RepID=UPI0036CF8E56